MNREKSGFLFALADMVTYGLLPVFSHYFVVMINPLLFGGLTMIVGAIPLIITMIRASTIKLLYKGDHLGKLAGFVALTTLGSIFFFLGAKLTSGINTGLLTQIGPLYALALAVLIMKEKTTIKQIVSMTIMVIGAMVLSYRGFGKINLGDILIITAPLFFQISHLIAKQINSQTNEPNLIPTARLLYGGMVLLAISLFIQPTAIFEVMSTQIIWSIIAFGLIFRTLDLWLWYQAIHRISPAKASALIPLAGLISFIGSLVILREQPTLSHYVGLILILGGITWYSHQQYIKS
ncbi:MAG: hypothetical protein UX64_C0004G0011 [Microgenomates group bacterium GW2011_GWC2_46_7]|nr:MAG: hypothetical protein UX64_C0004G0011 [Microgenomates group bacterium GW2011_GWC2_46_7]